MDIKEKIDQLVQFLREVRMEVKKVTWPSRQETMASTVVVLLVSIAVAIFLGVMDLGLAHMVSSFLH